LLEDLGFHLRNMIAWHYTFGQAQKRRFTPSWTPIFYVVKDPNNYTFNADAVRVPSDRQTRYNDRRANPLGKVPNDVWVLRPDQESPAHFHPATDVWKISRVAGTFKERAGHVTQLPLALAERIIRVASNPGDVVLDPFAGTGTVLVAAKR